MIATIVISCITFLAVTLSILFFPKIRIGKFHISTYWVIALVGAITLLACQLVTGRQVENDIGTSQCQLVAWGQRCPYVFTDFDAEPHAVAGAEDEGLV